MSRRPRWIGSAILLALVSTAGLEAQSVILYSGELLQEGKAERTRTFVLTGTESYAAPNDYCAYVFGDSKKIKGNVTGRITIFAADGSEAGVTLKGKVVEDELGDRTVLLCATDEVDFVSGDVLQLELKTKAYRIKSGEFVYRELWLVPGGLAAAATAVEGAGDRRLPPTTEPSTRIRRVRSGG